MIKKRKKLKRFIIHHMPTDTYYVSYDHYDNSVPNFNKMIYCFSHDVSDAFVFTKPRAETEMTALCTHRSGMADEPNVKFYPQDFEVREVSFQLVLEPK